MNQLISQDDSVSRRAEIYVFSLYIKQGVTAMRNLAKQYIPEQKLEKPKFQQVILRCQIPKSKKGQPVTCRAYFYSFWRTGFTKSRS